MRGANNIGPKRLVVGAHYGFKDWLSQRITAVVMATFTVILLLAVLFSKQTTFYFARAVYVFETIPILMRWGVTLLLLVLAAAGFAWVNHLQIKQKGYVNTLKSTCLKIWLFLKKNYLALILSVATLVFLVSFFMVRSFGYTAWANLFANQWMKILTFVTLVCLFWHAWVGVRDIWMDYVKPTGIRLGLQALTILWLVGCLGYAVQILWRV
jgi:succinate dehydrogenase / fumarate reductase, membrane anchor subunit